MAEIPAFPNTFIVQRDQDVSGISGEGIVAEGVQFSDGWVVTHWLDKPPMNEPKTDVWHNKGAEPFERIHGHGGNTRIVWADTTKSAAEFGADLAEIYDVPAALLGTEAERAYLHRRISRAFGASQSRRDVITEAFYPERHAAVLADVVMPIVGQVLEQRDCWRDAAGRAYRLADRWKAAHGSSMFLVRAAGAELREVLDDDQRAGPGPAAAECSAQYHGHAEGPRHCIRATQHRGDHIDEHGFHWSDTVAVYPTCVNAQHREHPGFSCEEVDQTRPYWNVRWGQEMAKRVAREYDDPTEIERLRRHIDELCAQRDSAVAAIERARELHRAVEHRGQKICAECSAYDADYDTTDGSPIAFEQCSTRRALSDADDRQACPYCTGAPQFPRTELGVHVEQTHGRVLAALARGVSLDELLHDPETHCRLSHEMEA